MGKRATAEQVPMSFSKRGGARLGAGRPRKRDAGPSHRKRPELSPRTPVHVTLRVREDVWNLRSRRCFEVVRAAYLAVGRLPDLRVANLSIQSNHLHQMAEAENARALSEGIHRLKIHLARGLNGLMGRTGPVFDEERFHQHVLDSPREVKRALDYIRWNSWKHRAEVGRPLSRAVRDPYTIGYFGDEVLLPEGARGMVKAPEGWLLRHGWRLGEGGAAAEELVPTRGRRRGGVDANMCLPLFGLDDELAAGEARAGDGGGLEGSAGVEWVRAA